ncbi:TPA: DUF910 domain-containing protein, partial [Listeria monocytogenes]|nr:DUF910 domain-containing protein [Listeria monocytogenes]EAE9921072.1 DUF910 domain-containing protein [Listeria monocytogenes]EAF1170036.1 DUF910 domain-containing protein [Listeria monocytogenes]EAF5602342.1 DUF910 domain-containing protein [Listeria monocytogenes]EAG1349832.1 DUF910 domain-containing protein [Listeria monocytogenes]
ARARSILKQELIKEQRKNSSLN